MYQTNSKIHMRTIALNAFFVGTLLLFPANKGLSDPKTWENLVERKNLFFEKFKKHLLMEKLKHIGQMAILKKPE